MAYRRAIEIQANHSTALNNLGSHPTLSFPTTSRCSGDRGGVFECGCSKLSTSPALARRFILQNVDKDINGAEGCFRRSLEAEPLSNDARVNLASLMVHSRSSLSHT